MSSVKKGFSIRIQLGMVSLILIAIFISATVIFVPWYVISTKNISTVVESLNEKIMEGVRIEVRRLFGNAILTQSIIRDTFAGGIIKLGEDEKREQYYFSLLKNNPDFSWISLGFPNGDFSGVQRLDASTMMIADSSWDAVKKSATRKLAFYRMNPISERVHLTSRRVLQNHPYCSLDRSWYKKATAGVGHIWTEVYVFDTSRKPGINSAVAFEVDGKFAGVISIALELEAISTYVSKLKVGETGIAFLMDSAGRLVAFPDQKELVRKGVGERVDLVEIGSSRNRHLKVVADSFKKRNRKPGDVDRFEVVRHTDRESGKEYFVTMNRADHLDWIICTVIPVDDYLGEVKRSVKYLILAVIALIAIAGFFLTMFSRHLMVRPILKITEQFQFIQDMRLDETSYVPTRIKEIGYLADGVVHMSRGLASFQKYLPTEIVRDMISQGIKAEINGEERDMTIFFSDIAGFTSIFEARGNSLVTQLGEYFSALSAHIHDCHGSIDKYIGDSIMAFWGAPKPNADHALDACRAALGCQSILSGLASGWERDGKPVFPTRMGINTGLVVVGNLGSETRLNYTVIGDPVNLSSRLESLNKFYGTQVLIGEETFRQAKQGIVARRLDEVAVYGKHESNAVYELIALRDTVHVTDNFDWIGVYERARIAYKAREWVKAAGLFEQVSKMRGGQDKPSSLFLVLCLEYMKNPPAEDWTGITVMGKK